MELNLEVKQILLDFNDFCNHKNWNKEEKDIRATYDTFRIQNLMKYEER